ncbi:MAG: hypothetical protein HC895_21955 [Leptolyngbyaceae cyanobacterium SM1_3_5]|nr:hypothetical protein [Leptolyngbyaceae cyanobacterium SM1_3_5]
MPRQKRQFSGLSYREVQRANSQNRKKLHKSDQKQLKTEGYKNTGWDHVIRLYQKIEELLDRYQYADLELDELFLEADRIGNKYLTSEEIEEYNQKLAKEVSEIEEAIDQQFPDAEVEIIDFGDRKKTRSR